NHDSQPPAYCSYAAEALLHHLQQLLIEAHFVNAIILLDLGNKAVNTSYIRVANQLQSKRSGQKIQLSHRPGAGAKLLLKNGRGAIPRDVGYLPEELFLHELLL